jgi:hypothetical protein
MAQPNPHDLSQPRFDVLGTGCQQIAAGLNLVSLELAKLPNAAPATAPAAQLQVIMDSFAQLRAYFAELNTQLEAQIEALRTQLEGGIEPLRTQLEGRSDVSYANSDGLADADELDDLFEARYAVDSAWAG